ncbi:MAG: flagellar biosynthesis protein FlhF [Planctomycetes bacterium]|nr:flagellar biosynthesis protein FlhF [Planctomycetota bacterium]
MEVHEFTGATMQEALARAKASLGADAVVLQTRVERRGGILGRLAAPVAEVRAIRAQDWRAGLEGGEARAEAPARRGRRLSRAYGLEPAPAGTAPAAPAPREGAGATATAIAAPPLPRGGGGDDLQLRAILREVAGLRGLVAELARHQRGERLGDFPATLQDAYARLREAEVREDLAREVVVRVNEELCGAELRDPACVQERVHRLVSERVRVAGPIPVGHARGAYVVALIGPTGVGKTTTIAKLAGRLAIAGVPVGLVTVDNYRIAAVEQLRTYADIIGVPLRAVTNPHELRRAIAELADRAVILVDTAGRSPRDDLKLNELAAYLEAAGPQETHLVVSATTARRDLGPVLGRYGRLRANRLIVTKLDEAVVHGTLLDMIESVPASLSYLTTGQEVPADIEPAAADRVAGLVLRAHPEEGETRPGFRPEGV